MDDPQPSEIELRKKAKELRVTWRSHEGTPEAKTHDHVSVLPLWYVRGYCPCARCQGHGDGQRFVRIDDPELVDIREVGRYAVALIWADGHDTGIYSFGHLRALCPCEACLKAQGAAHPLRRATAP